ncbi:related to thermoresistant gluconokinase [Ustilago trichophora]|uniref:gluconokinase n=1 Tax=Ustilago trichophora TaxID=86804 RepID=A0A5C3EIZ4_9BASI|nr:related to thermoresistant gluconokinase [Ustilago trichophora]
MSGVKSMPTLLIVMGTSGSGKSTVGAALSNALSCPFVDGDDLHPSSNVEKMSTGQPLNDDDREPWLLTIRRKGLELAETQNVASISKGEKADKEVVEVLETSQQTTTLRDIASQHTQNNNNNNNNNNINEGHNAATKGSKNKLAIIACSSLKLNYRRLLRGTLTSLADPAALKPESDVPTPTDLRVIHIYLDLSKELLEERMANRKGHFMKLDMLYSQLDTLQRPNEEEEVGTVVVKVERDSSTEDIVRGVVERLKGKGVI